MLLPDYKLYISGLTQNMETFKVKDPTDLWEPWNDCGKLHIGYVVSINMFTFFNLLGPWIGGMHHCFTKDYFHYIP
jgi:hypothetical protein